MNNKFIRALVIINGILIPIFIILILGILIKDLLKNSADSFLKDEENTSWEEIIDYSNPQEIPNSENYYVSKFKTDAINNIPIETVVRIGSIPEKTVNIVFLNKEYEKIGKLLEEDASIKEIYIPSIYSNNQNEIELTQNILYFIATEDSNNDGAIDASDKHYLYISDLNGKNLNRILDNHVEGYKFINDFKEVSITYLDKDMDLAVGVYSIESNVFTPLKTLNFE